MPRDVMPSVPQNIVTEARDWKLLAHGLESELNPDIVVSTPVGLPEIPFHPEVHRVIGELYTLMGDVVAKEMYGKGKQTGAWPKWGMHGYEVRDGVLHVEVKPTTYYHNALEWRLAQQPDMQRRVFDVSERVLGDRFALLGRTMAFNSSVHLMDEDSKRKYKSEIESRHPIPKEAFPYALVTFRSLDQFEYWLTFHNVGGHPKEDDLDEGQLVPDWHRAMRSQICKEIGVEDSDISRIELIGLGEHARTYKPELLYRTCVTRTPREVLGLEGKERQEAMGLVVLENLGEVRELIERNQVKATEGGGIYNPLVGGNAMANLQYQFMIKSFIMWRKKHWGQDLDPNTSTNLVPVGEAQLALMLQLEGIDVSDIYRR